MRHEDTEIVEGPLIQTCKGCLDPHPFLNTEGIHVCALCGGILCRVCFMNEKNVIPDGYDRFCALNARGTLFWEGVKKTNKTCRHS